MSRKDKYKSREELLKKVEVLRDEAKEAYREADEANSKIEKLEERNEELKESLDDVTDKQEREFMKGLLAGILGLAVFLLVFAFLKWLLFAADEFTPSTDALEDAFISAGDEYDDGEHVFDFDAYMNKNGFKFDFQTTSDDANDGYVSRYYRRGDISIELEIDLDYDKYDFDSDTRLDVVASKIWIDLDHGAAGPHYIAEWSSNFNETRLDEFVHDNGSMFFFHREALIALDAVLKSGNLDNAYSCPFKHLGIRHQVVNDLIFSLHDD